jgi:hypothetical protein
MNTITKVPGSRLGPHARQPRMGALQARSPEPEVRSQLF